MLAFVIMLASLALSLGGSFYFYMSHINATNMFNIITKYPVLLSPIHIVYILAFAIYILLFYWALHAFKTRHEAPQRYLLRTIIFCISMVAQCGVYYAWHNESAGTLVASQLILVLSLYVLYRSFTRTQNHLAERGAIAIYLAWTTFTLLFMTELLLVALEWTGFGLSRPLWAIIFLTVGVAIALYFRFHYNDKFFPAIFIVHYVGIAIHQLTNELLVTLAALFLSFVLFVGILYLQKPQKPLDDKLA